MRKTIIIGGGTFNHIRSHLSLATPAFGTTAKKIHELMPYADLILTKMAEPSSKIITNRDLDAYTNNILEDKNVGTIIFNAAVCDFDGQIGDVAGDKYAERLRTSDGDVVMNLTPATKIISKIRRKRPDIFLVAFKTTAGMNFSDQCFTALKMMKKSKCNLVLANDVITRNNSIITPEESFYHIGEDRDKALQELVEMAKMRGNLTYHRTHLTETLPMRMQHTPSTFQTVVGFLINNGGFIENNGNGFTPGHFAFRQAGGFWSSQRSVNHNNVFKDDGGLTAVRIIDGKIEATGNRKPSVGAMSQHLMFNRYPDFDCIVHTHNPLKQDGILPVVDQKPFQCGSLECGANTVNGMKEIDGIMAVYAKKHGANFMFKSTDSPSRIIDFIRSNIVLGVKVK